ncbi:MAG: reverse transcriptase domain-containing protein [Candidatus Thiodiazotropha sp.]
MPTPVKWEMLRRWLIGYPKDKADFLISGFKQGFKLGYEGPRCYQTSPNLKSALDKPDIVFDKITSELQAGRISGPHQSKPFENFKVSPLGIVPKKNPGEYRLIHHLSFPRNSGRSVNENIPDTFATVSYAGIQEAISQNKQLGRGCYMSKTDIRSAFRICPIYPGDQELLGFEWEGQLYYDRCLPFGARSSCQIFERLSSALEWIALHKLGCQAVVYILDDFLFINKTEAGCSRDLKAFLTMCGTIGIPIAEEKTCAPNTSMTFVGISLCSVRMEASLPTDKLQKCRALLHEFCSKKSCKLRDLQSLLGYLNFCCSVITCGRAFLRRLIDLTIGISKPFFHVRFNKDTRSDIQLWLSFLDQYNGRSMFLNDSFLTSQTLRLYTDSAKSLGYGAVYGTQWLYGEFPSLGNSLALPFWSFTLSFWQSTFGAHYGKTIVFYSLLTMRHLLQ